MEPSNNPNFVPQVSHNPESVPSGAQKPEVNQSDNTSSEQASSPEMGAPASYEADTANREAANQNQGRPLPPVVVDPVTPTTQPPQTDISPQQDDPSTALNPVTADDVDVVEKEWVDRARKIVEETRDNPHKQEQEVEKLQMDYLKKRYGKDLKSADA